MMSQTEIFTWSFAFGVLGGAFTVAMIYYWLWEHLHPSKFDMEWVKSEVKDLRKELESECCKRQCVEDRVHAIEKPEFKPKFGDWVKAERPDKSGLSPVVYMYEYKRDGKPVHRCIGKNNMGGTHEFDTYTVEPLDD